VKLVVAAAVEVAAVHQELLRVRRDIVGLGPCRDKSSATLLDTEK
jgi:hypothetical protein